MARHAKLPCRPQHVVARSEFLKLRGAGASDGETLVAQKLQEAGGARGRESQRSSDLVTAAGIFRAATCARQARRRCGNHHARATLGRVGTGIRRARKGPLACGAPAHLQFSRAQAQRRCGKRHARASPRDGG